MTATNHAVTGMLIGAAISVPVIAIALAFISYFILDLMPHVKFKKHDGAKFLYFFSMDLGVAMALMLAVALLQPTNWLQIVICGVIGILPGLMWLPDWWKENSDKKLPKPNFIKKLYSHFFWGKTGAKIGIAYELGWFVITFIFLSQALIQ